MLLAVDTLSNRDQMNLCGENVFDSGGGAATGDAVQSLFAKALSKKKGPQQRPQRVITFSD